MPGELYNAGRVVGMSAWEIYVRQSLLLNPDVEPLSERDWLSENVGVGRSLLLKVSADNISGFHKRDFNLPSNSLLCAPNTIIGSFFFGEADTMNDDGWCKRITDYGPGISNTSASSPTNGNVTAHSVPTQTLAEVSDTVQKRMMQYIKIQDAIILQEGTWSDSGVAAPKKTFVPDITKPSMLRITFEDSVTEDFYLLLTGFSTRAIIKGEVGFDMGSVVPDDEAEAAAFRVENGDFLGPALYPWANKVVFTYPPVLTYLLRKGLQPGDNSVNLKITSPADSTITTIDGSTFEAGAGIQLNDPSTAANRAKKITVSAKVKSANKYMGVAQQAKTTHAAEGDASQTPTTLTVSPAAAGPGITITDPSAAGEPHTINAKITVDTGNNYLRVTQRSEQNPSISGTVLTPSYPNSGKGIGITPPATAGATYNISSLIKVEGDGINYIKVEQISANDANTATTTLKPSKAVSGLGACVVQPSDAGGSFTISAKMETSGEASKYIQIDQVAGAASGDVCTTLTPSKIISGKGIGITQPSAAGANITIGAPMKTEGDGSRYIKITQTDGSTDASNNVTVLKPSKLDVKLDSNRDNLTRLVIEQPTEDGGNVLIDSNIHFTQHAGIGIWDDPINGMTHISSVVAIGGEGAMGLKVDQTMNCMESHESETTIDEATTTLSPSRLVVDSRNFGKKATDAERAEGIEDSKDLLKIIYPGNTDTSTSQIYAEDGTTDTVQLNHYYTYGGGSQGDPIKFYLDEEELFRRLLQTGPIRSFLENFTNDLLEKIYYSQKIFEASGEAKEKHYVIWTGTNEEIGHIHWQKVASGEDDITDTLKIPLGNLNLYSNDQSGDAFEHTIRSREGDTDNDLRLK